MNELIESDEEINAADTDIVRVYQEGSSGAEDEDDYDSDERSLMDSDDERDTVKK